MKSRTQFSSFSTLYYYIIQQGTQNIILGPKIEAFLCVLTTLLIHNIAGIHSFKNRYRQKHAMFINLLDLLNEFFMKTLLMYTTFIYIANIKRMLILKTYTGLLLPHTHLALPIGLLHYEFVTCNPQKGNIYIYFFVHSCTMHLDVIIFLFHQWTHRRFVQECIKIYIKIAPTCFGLTTILREHIIDLS